MIISFLFRFYKLIYSLIVFLAANGSECLHERAVERLAIEICGGDPRSSCLSKPNDSEVFLNV